MIVLGLMSEVARAGRMPSRQTRNLIRDAAEYLGIPGHRWPEVQERLQLVIHDPWSVLGLNPGASTQEVKKAYRTKLKGLHPDRVHGLDSEIQELAEARTIELRQAYEACLDALS
jgi:DnaJ like chaperone protein